MLAIFMVSILITFYQNFILRTPNLIASLRGSLWRLCFRQNLFLVIPVLAQLRMVWSVNLSIALLVGLGQRGILNGLASSPLQYLRYVSIASNHVQVALIFEFGGSGSGQHHTDKRRVQVSYLRRIRAKFLRKRYSQRRFWLYVTLQHLTTIHPQALIRLTLL